VCEVGERDLIGKVNAGQAGSGQELGEAAFRLAGFERNAVDKKFVVGNTQQEPVVAAQRNLQLRPCCFELTVGPLVADTVQPGVLYQDIETVDESTRDNSLLAEREIRFSDYAGK
jgi:hypothetical protein